MTAFLKDIPFIINPKSGTSRKKNLINQLKKIQIKLGIQFKILTSTAPGDVKTKCQEIKDQSELVFVAGGDGTVNEAAMGLQSSQTSLAIVPSGSGNGLARHLGLPKDPGRCIYEMLVHGTTINADMISVNNHQFINVAGIGFDGLISRKFSQDKKRGLLTYLKHILFNFWSSKDFQFQLKADDTELSGKAWMISLANGSEFGNGAKISPESSVCDGKLEIVIIQKPSLINALVLATEVMLGKKKSSQIKRISASSFLIILNKAIDLHLDGEYVGAEKKLVGQVLKSNIQLRVADPSRHF